MDPKGDPEAARRHPKGVPKTDPENDTKMDPKWSPKGPQNGPKMSPKAIKKRSVWATGGEGCPGMGQDDPKCIKMGQRAPKMNQNELKISQK